jgi:hypothetical protein
MASEKKIFAVGSNADGILLTGVTNGSAGTGNSNNHTVQLDLSEESILGLSGVNGDPVRITGVATPTSATDAASKGYVDSVADGLDIKASVRTSASRTAVAALNGGYNASAGVLTFNSTGTLTIDSVLLSLNDRVLIGAGAAAHIDNGIYYVSTAGAVGVAAVLTRASDCNASSEFAGATVFVESGTNTGKRYHCLYAASFVVNTDANEWTQYGAAGDGGEPTDNSVSTNKIQDSAVTTDKIADDAVTTDKLDDSAVTAAKIASGTITSTQLAADSVTNTQIADNAVVENKIAAGAVTSGKIGSGQVTNTHLATDSVQQGQIQNGAVVESKIAAGAVTSGKIGSGQVTNTHLAADSVQQMQIQNGAVIDTKIADNAVTDTKINNNAVTTDKINDSAVTNGKLASTALYNNNAIGVGIGASGARLAFSGGEFDGLYSSAKQLMDLSAGELVIAGGSSVDGDFSVDGAFTATSWSACEEKWKDDVRDVVDPLGSLSRLEPKTWVYRDDAPICAKQRSAGFLAENLFKVFPDSVRLDERLDGRVVNDKYVLAAAVAAINQLSAAVTALETRCDALEKQLKAHVDQGDHCCVDVGCISPCHCDAH